MLLNRQSTVVESTLLELFKQNQPDENKAHKKTVHVLLFYHLMGVKEYVQQIRDLYDQGIRVIICPDDELLKHHKATEIARMIGIDDFISIRDLEAKKDTIEHIYIPVLSFSTVSDIIQFNDMRSSIRMIMWALMSGKKVTAFTAGANPTHPMWKSNGLDEGTAFLKHQMRKQLQQLKGFGIHLIDEIENLASYFIPTTTSSIDNKKRVITANTIQKEVEAGKRSIHIDQQTIITPLARDLAKKYQLVIGEYRGGRT